MQNSASTIKSRISPYEKKILELRGLIQDEAKTLQNTIEAKDIALKEIRETRDEKSRIEGVISNLKINQKEAEEALLETISRKTKFIESTKLELKKEKTALSETSEMLNKTTEKITELMPVVREIEAFISKEGDARERFLQAESIFVTSKERTEKTVGEAQKIKAEIEEKTKSYEGLKTYVSDLYGKLASYVKAAQATIDHVNECLENNELPFYFKVPKGEELEINMDNFDNKHSTNNE